jgi:hypothetical protein
MTFTIHDPRLLYAPIVTRIATETTRPAELGIKPEGASTPYAVVYPFPDRQNLGTLTNPTEISQQLFQVTCVGDTTDEAQAMQKEVREALLDWAPTVVGFECDRIDLDLGSGLLRDDDGPVFYTTDRFNLYVE